MRGTSWARALPSIILTALVSAAPAAAQGLSQAAAPAAAAKMSSDEIAAFAKVQVAIDVARDTAQAQLALPRNTKEMESQQIRDNLQSQIAEILHHAGMTKEEYQHKTYVISTDTTTRKAFDAMVAKLSGVPTPGQVVSQAGTVPVPAGPVGTHIGHVVNSFPGTPNGQGLLPTAIAEARIAMQHATLGAQNPSNLAAMKLHAGHVINALDPTIVTAGPGLGYGVKKAATGVATHIELAAKAPGASQNVIMHSVHVATSARNTVERSDSIIVLAKLVQAANTAPEAAALMTQIVSLSNQLIAGFDANGDGRVSWDKGEGGLQQAQDHVNLMLAGEKGR